MSKLIELYNKTHKTNKSTDKVDGNDLLSLPRPKYDIDFNKTSMIELYNKYEIKSTNPTNSQALLDKYYKEYGYTSLISEVGGYLLGIKDASSLLKSGLSKLIPGASRGGITSVLLSAANIVLRNPFIESTINNVLNFDPLDLKNSRITYQSIPPTVLLSSNPPIIGEKNESSNLVSATIKSLGISALLPTISGVMNSGTLTNYDWQQALGKGLNATEIILLSKQGIKYTKPVGWVDMTKPSWSNDKGQYLTYDKYIGYGNELTYSKLKDVYKDTLLDRYGKWSQKDYTTSTSPSDLLVKSGISNKVLPSKAVNSLPSPISNIINNKNADTLKLYQKALGNNTDPLENPEDKYSNRTDIRDKINKLGFMQFNKNDAQQNGQIEDSRDKINMLDIGEDYNEDLRDTIKFKIYDVFNKEVIIFRAVLSAITTTISPTWNANKYLGRADNFFTYDSTQKQISFAVTVYANSKDEVVPLWRKINRIVGLCYPTEYKDDNVMRGPIVQLTIGDLYHDVYGHFSSLNVTIDETTLWDTDEGYQLPMVVALDISFQVMYEGVTPQTKIAHFNRNQTKFNILKSGDAQQAQTALPGLPTGNTNGNR